jgi:tetratricopeptide (TPR) repeat protein
MKRWFASLAFAAAVALGGRAAGEEPAPPKDPTPDQAYHEALNFFQNKEFDRAEEVLDRVLAARPDSFYARYLRGACRLSAGRYLPAFEDFDAVVRMKPEFAKAIAQRGRSSLGLEGWDDAIRDLESALRIDPSDKGWKQDLEQARMLKRGATECGPGTAFPALPLELPGAGEGASSRKLPEGFLIPLLSAAERSGRLLGGGNAAFRGVWILFFSSVDNPLDRNALSELQEALPDLAGRGFAAAAISPEPSEKLAGLRESKDLGFPLFSDPMGRSAWKLGILNLRRSDFGEPLPAWFLVDAKGIVRARKVALDAHRRDPLEKVLKDFSGSITKDAPGGK